VVDGDELDCVGAWLGALSVVFEAVATVFVLFLEVFTVARVLAFRVDFRTTDELALGGVDTVADLTTCVFPVATSAAISAVAAVAAVAVQRVMCLTRRRLVARILVARVCRSVVMETSDQGDLANGPDVPVCPLRACRGQVG
jgi:hypothetical protein